MVKIFSTVIALSLLSLSSFGKSVDENTAKTTGNNFCKTQGLAMGNAGISLAYTATSVVNGNEVADFYVFNTGADGFVMVAADDAVAPVLAWSDESAFNAAFIPGDINWWLGKYKSQISNVIKNNTPATAQTQQKWADLAQTPVSSHAAARTSTVVTPLMRTLWNQSPFYNYMCPYDSSQSQYVVTGCVATAMAQVMKYWNWPARGVGNHAYTSAFGPLSANFGATVYQWDSMPRVVNVNNAAVGLLMLQTGISVDMSYGVSGSSAAVLRDISPDDNCAQSALVNYFSYKNTIQGLSRNSFDDSGWVHTLKAEIDAKRPVIYTGYGDQGGHCFIADGYTNANFLHFNWGWGGYANAYFIVENLDPGTETFNYGEAVLTNIMPDSTVVEGVQEVAAAGNGINIYPNPALATVNIDLGGVKTTAITLTDATGRVVRAITPAANATTVSIPVSGLSAGLYIATLQTEQGTISRKVIVGR